MWLITDHYDNIYASVNSFIYLFIYLCILAKLEVWETCPLGVWADCAVKKRRFNGMQYDSVIISP